MRGLVAVLIAIVLAPALTFGQWLKYPTEGLPRTADGKVNANAPTPRLPDGKPDLSGLWHASNPARCITGTGQFVECGAEIGGAPAGGDPGRNLPRGRPPYKPWLAMLGAERQAGSSRG